MCSQNGHGGFSKYLLSEGMSPVPSSPSTVFHELPPIRLTQGGDPEAIRGLS